ncbi:MAG: 16S rRNA (uracil(1498)-N(3))-methyltransferase [Tepidimonas sp.]|uniref:16S rRNA (uracil(1498)-N(3))-methyltransferase n=1 Tax=Tepidimonas sp. TaxID=2002775 RepID=UPI004054FF51
MAAPRIYHPDPLAAGQTVALSAAASRHAQVLRLQAGDALTLFGDPVRGGEWAATVVSMGRRIVTVRVDAHRPVEREPGRALHLAVGMPANERMDWLVEKATELGVASIQPLLTARSVLRLHGERADKKVAHWQAVAAAACEQCGGNRVPMVHPVLTLQEWLARLVPAGQAEVRAWLSLADSATPVARWTTVCPNVARVVIGPEGGLTPQEETTLHTAGWHPVSLGPRVLRSETAALALAALVALAAHPQPAPYSRI